MPRSRKLTQSEQHQRFVETARQLGADEDEAAFKAKLAVIARQKFRDAPGNAKGENDAEKHDV